MISPLEDAARRLEAEWSPGMVAAIGVFRSHEAALRRCPSCADGEERALLTDLLRLIDLGPTPDPVDDEFVAAAIEYATELRHLMGCRHEARRR